MLLRWYNSASFLGGPIRLKKESQVLVSAYRFIGLITGYTDLQVTLSSNANSIEAWR